MALCGAEAVQTARIDGDFARGAPNGIRRQLELTRSTWTTVRQVHGSAVLTVGHSAGADAGDADGIVTAEPNVPLAVVGADCALVALSSPEGVIGVAHAGWRGLAAGVIGATAGAMRALGATRLDAVVGPMIHPECYPFGAADLDRLAGLLGPGVRGATRDGDPAFDLPAAVATALDGAGVVRTATLGGCTACEEGSTPGAPRWFSHRARGDLGRHALVIWRSGS